MFSRRTDHDDEPNPLAAALAHARGERRELLDLTVSSPADVGLGLWPDQILSPLADPRSLRYEPRPFGLDEAREAVAREMGVEASRTVLTASTSEAYSFAFALLADPGDVVLVPRPSYPLLEWLARLSGVSLVPYDLRYDGSWYLDRASVREAISPEARAIVSVSPNNPTGSCLTEDDRDFLLDLGLPLVVDEVFARYPLGPGSAPRLPTATRGLVLRLSGLSKLASLPQMKLGFIALEGGPREVAEALRRLELVADTFLSVSTPVQHAAERWLEAASLARPAVVERCRQNLAELDHALAGSAAHRLDVEAGWYAIVRFPDVIDEEQLALRLLEAKVVTQPGFYFDLPFRPCVVVSLLPEPETFARAAALLRAEVDRLLRA